jgi:hypothetical protein|tara:strand:+ start:525 stop:719 length:195 start_codon:yes stop_codon:yes gene_type:complete
MPKTNWEKNAAAMETAARNASPRAWRQTDPPIASTSTTENTTSRRFERRRNGTGVDGDDISVQF